MTGFSGIGSAYEAPDDAEIVIDRLSTSAVPVAGQLITWKGFSR